MPQPVRPHPPTPVHLKPGVRLAKAGASPRDIIGAEDYIAVAIIEGEGGIERYEANYERYNRMTGRHIWRFPDSLSVEEGEEGWVFLEAVCPS